eukprot:TRINITY_DN2458_c0_g1_i4.p1 TRINITY_DN2458_c0_g1~~TRINITY_DN2458_c0_g1_i4.p1  ORF type:complete len:248 (+),score=56.91 TRINITY_DN2458_c0_g1_i4:68-811(+)
MAKLTMNMLRCIAMLGALQPANSYHYVGDCVPGGIVAGLTQAKGMVGGYTVALQTILPFLKDLKVLAAGPNDKCLAAADAVNTNDVMVQKGNIKGVLKLFPEMKEVGLGGILKKGNETKSYLYVFDLKDWQPYEFLGQCVDGGIVKDLNVTGGKLKPYAEALQKTAQSIYGDIAAIASTDHRQECETVVSRLNAGNATLHKMIIRSKLAAVTPIPPWDQNRINVSEDKTYMVVFKNKAWNTTDQWWI